MTHKDALIEAHVTGWSYRAEHETDPKQCVADLIAAISREATDPVISQAAADLVESGRKEAAATITQLGRDVQLAYEDLRKLREERDHLKDVLAEATAERRQQAELLTGVARALFGPAPKGSAWGWSGLPETAEQMHRQVHEQAAMIVSLMTSGCDRHVVEMATNRFDEFAASLRCRWCEIERAEKAEARVRELEGERRS